VEEIEQMAPSHIIISPGPGNPDEAGISKSVVRRFAGKTPVFGGVVEGAGEILHGKVSRVTHDGRGVFAGITSPIDATRYHSLAIRPDSVPDVLEVSALSESGISRGVRHRTLAVEGVQFHPESILTPEGHAILRNFLAMSA
jgi:anthranilate synthase/aminodeoxychorismate synthase-like glutamine amidotransferase